MILHVIPINDIKEHVVESICSCNPKLIKENNSYIYNHNSYDNREAIEQACEIVGGKYSCPDKKWAIFEE